MWQADAPLILGFAGAEWPYGPARVEVTLSLATTPEHRSRIEAPGDGLALLVDPSLPPPADEGPLAVEAGELRRFAALRPLPPLVVRVKGARPPAPGASVALARALDVLLAAAGLAPTPDAKPAPPAGSGLAWLSEHAMLFVDPLVPKAGGWAPGAALASPRSPSTSHEHEGRGPGAQPPAGGEGADAFEAAAVARPTSWPQETAAPELDAAALARDARAVVRGLAPIAALPGASWRERQLTTELVAAGLAARWLIGRAASGGRIGLALVADGRARELEAALAERGHAPSRITFDPPPLRARAIDWPPWPTPNPDDGAPTA